MSEELSALKSELAALAAKMNAKHLLIAKGLVDNKSQEQAYLEAGYKSKNANADANKTITRYPVITQYVELVKKIDALVSLPKQIATREQKRAMLWDIANSASKLRITLKGGSPMATELMEEGDEEEPILEIFDASAAKTAVAAIAELNKMDGDLAVIKTENRNITVESLIDELTGGNGK